MTKRRSYRFRWIDVGSTISDQALLMPKWQLALLNVCTGNWRNRRRHSAGFTLIEIVVALAILALSAAVMLNQISNGIAQASRADGISEAGMLAQSLLARVGTELPLRQGEFTGQFASRYRWELRVTPSGDANDLREMPVGAYDVVAEVFWSDGIQERSIALRTLRIGPKDASQ
jgi:general secretion pathway protein I